MNPEIRKFLKRRLACLNFNRYSTITDDTPTIKRLRREIDVREKKINTFETMVYSKKSVVLQYLEKIKTTAYEVIYGNDYDKALEAVKDVEKEFDKASSKNYGI